MAIYDPEAGLYDKSYNMAKPGVPGAEAYEPLGWYLSRTAEKNAQDKNNDGKPDLPPDPSKKPDPANPGGGGGYGYGYGGGGGGGSSASAGLSQYIQEYRIKFFINGKPPADLLKQATQNNWTLLYFDQRVRLEDPHYFKSAEARAMLPVFNRTMKVLFPALADRATEQKLMKSSFYRQTALWYLQNGVGTTTGGEELLYSHITNTKQWNKANPYWKDYAQNKNVGVQAEANPLLYKQYLQEMKDAYQQVGLENVPDDYFRTFYQSRYASQSGLTDLTTNLKGYAQTGGSMGWWQGKKMDSGQVKTATLDAGQTGFDLRKRMATAFGVEGSFKGTQEHGFDTQLNQQGQLVKPTL